MTLGHALFAGALTLYMLIAVVFKKRDLVRLYGAVYRRYQRRVPMFIPRIGSGSTDGIEGVRGAVREPARG